MLSWFADINKQANEYCIYETFHPNCSKNEVIVMSSATYGRMNVGRCLKLDTASKHDPKYFGCSANVLEFMDRKCSGRSECNVRVIDQELLQQESSCYEDLMKYLELIYTCVAGKYTVLLISDFGFNQCLSFYTIVKRNASCRTTSARNGSSSCSSSPV